jgi:hypothetical protein
MFRPQDAIEFRRSFGRNVDVRIEKEAMWWDGHEVGLESKVPSGFLCVQVHRPRDYNRISEDTRWRHQGKYLERSNAVYCDELRLVEKWSSLLLWKEKWNLGRLDILLRNKAMTKRNGNVLLCVKGLSLNRITFFFPPTALPYKIFWFIWQMLRYLKVLLYENRRLKRIMFSKLSVNVLLPRNLELVCLKTKYRKSPRKTGEKWKISGLISGL